MTTHASVFTSSDSDEDKLGRFIGGSSVSVVSSVIAGLFALGWAVLMTGMLGKEQYAVLGPYMQVFWIITTVTSFGVPHTLMTFISHHYETDFDSAADFAIQGNKLLFVIIAIFIGIAGAVIFGLWVAGVLHGLYLGLCIIMLVCAFSRQMFFGNYASMAGVQRMDCLSLTNTTFSIMLPFMSVGFLIAVRRAMPGNGSADIAAGAAGIGVAAFFSYLFSVLINTKTALPPKIIYSFRRPLTRWREILTFGWKTNVALVGNTFVSMLPPVFVSYVMAQGLKWYGPTAEINRVRAGEFSSAFTYAMAPLLVVGLTFALLPAMSEADSQGNRVLLNKYFNTSVKYCFSIIAMITALYSVIIGRLISMLTKGIYSATAIHPIAFFLELSVAGGALFFLFMSMLIGLKRPGVAARTVACVLIIEATAMLLAGRFTGSLTMTALAVASSLLLGATYLLLYLVTKVKLKMNWAIFFPPVVSAAVVWLLCGVAIPYPAVGNMIKSFSGIILSNDTLGSILPCIIGPPVFFLLDGLLGGVEHGDLNTLRSTLKSLRLGFAVFVIDVIEWVFGLSPFFKKSGV